MSAPTRTAADPELVIAAADELVDAVHRLDRAGVQAAFDRWCASYDGDHPEASRALLVLLAAAVPHDAPLRDVAAAFLADPTRYRRLRGSGMPESRVLDMCRFLDQKGAGPRA